MVLKAMKNCLKKKLSGKTFLSKKSLKIFFLSSEIFQSLKMFRSSCEKQFCVLNTNFKIGNFKIPMGHLRLGWKLEPRLCHWSQLANSAI